MSGRSCPREITSFLNPWGAGPELSQSEGPERQETLGSAIGSPSEGTWGPGDTNEGGMTYRGACPETDSRRKGQVSLLSGVVDLSLVASPGGAPAGVQTGSGCRPEPTGEGRKEGSKPG